MTGILNVKWVDDEAKRQLYPSGFSLLLIRGTPSSLQTMRSSHKAETTSM